MSYSVNGKIYDTWSSENQNILSKLVGREIYCCMTSEMEYMLKMTDERYDEDNPVTGFAYDEMCRPVCSECGSMYDIKSCRVDELDKNQFKREPYIIEETGEEIEGYVCPVCGEVHEDIEEAVECCGGHTTVYVCENCGTVFSDIDELNYGAPDVFEWWAVSCWFGEKLKDKGEIVIESYGKSYWGRTCTGQSICLDSVIADIASDMGILQGMEHDWSNM